MPLNLESAFTQYIAPTNYWSTKWWALTLPIVMSVQHLSDRAFGDNPPRPRTLIKNECLNPIEWSKVTVHHLKDYSFPDADYEGLGLKPKLVFAPGKNVTMDVWGVKDKNLPKGWTTVLWSKCIVNGDETASHYRLNDNGYGVRYAPEEDPGPYISKATPAHWTYIHGYKELVDYQPPSEEYVCTGKILKINK